MDKLLDLRNHLLARIPDLARGPDRLLTFIENGKIELWAGENLSHFRHMPVKVIVTDWRGSADDIIIPVLEWMQLREPGRDPRESIVFDTEIISADCMDIMFTLQITERVIVIKEENSEHYKITHVLPDNPPL